MMSDVPGDIGRLLDEAKDGSLSPDDGRAVVEAIDSSVPTRTLYTLVNIVAHARPAGAEDVLVRLLDYEEDPQVAALAMRTLGDQWHQFDLVRAEAVAALRGLPWDTFDDVRDAAVTVAGEYLRHRVDPEMLELLVSLAIDADPFERGHRLHALGRALGASDLELAERNRSQGRWSDDDLVETGLRRLASDVDD